MLSRREMVGKLAAGAAVAWAASAGRVGAAVRQHGANPQIDPQAASLSSKAPEAPLAVQQTSAPIAEESTPAASGTAPWELLRPLVPGSVVAYGWRVADLSGVADGACVLTLKNERGRTHRIHLCRNDGSPEGLVYTDRFDLVVMNGGRGDLHTEEGLAQAVAAVAHILADNERAWHRRANPNLLSHAQRMRQLASAEN